MKHECKSCLLAIGDETRVSIYFHLLNKDLCVKELKELLNLSQSTVSYHLDVLEKRGLLNKKQSGRKSIFSVNTSCPFYKSECVLSNLTK